MNGGKTLQKEHKVGQSKNMEESVAGRVTKMIRGLSYKERLYSLKQRRLQ